MDEHIVIGLAFIVSVLLLLKPAVNLLKNAFSSYSKKISDNIDCSFQKKEDVYSLMISYLEKNKNLNSEANEIIGNARRKAEEMKVDFIKEIDGILNQKVEYMTHVFNNNLKMAVEEMELNAVKIATEAVKCFIEENYASDKEKQSEVFLNFSDEFSRKKLN